MTDEDPTDDPPPATTVVRLALVAGVFSGLVYLVTVPLLRPEQVGLATDVYYHAVEAALAGGDPYGATPPGRPGFSFVYPPIVLLAFLPHYATGGPLGAFLFQTALNAATALALAAVLLRVVERTAGPLARLDRWLLVAFVLASVHTVPVLVMGQVNLQLSLAVAVGGLLVERSLDGAAVGDDGAGDDDATASRSEAAAGVAFALAASVKVFPAVAGAWLLRLRAWRGVAAALGTGLAGLAVGLAAFGPATTRTYLIETLASERQAGAFEGGLSPEVMFVTVRRPLAAVAPDLDPGLLGLAAVAVLTPFVLASYRDVSTGRGRRLALLATLVATLAYLPLEPFYYSLLYYPLVPLLYELPAGRARRLLVAGTVLLSATMTYPSTAGLLDVAPLAPSLASTLDSLAHAAFGVAQPPLVGVLLILLACVQGQREAANRGT